MEGTVPLAYCWRREDKEIEVKGNIQTFKSFAAVESSESKQNRWWRSKGRVHHHGWHWGCKSLAMPSLTQGTRQLLLWLLLPFHSSDLTKVVLPRAVTSGTKSSFLISFNHPRGATVPYSFLSLALEIVENLNPCGRSTCLPTFTLLIWLAQWHLVQQRGVVPLLVPAPSIPLLSKLLVHSDQLDGKEEAGNASPFKPP